MNFEVSQINYTSFHYGCLQKFVAIELNEGRFSYYTNSEQEEVFAIEDANGYEAYVISGPDEFMKKIDEVDKKRLPILELLKQKYNEVNWEEVQIEDKAV